MNIEARARELLLDADPEAIAAWRAEHPANDAALREAQLTWTAIGRTQFARDDSWRGEVARGRRPPSWAVPAAAMAASLAVAAVVGPQVLGPSPGEVRTAIAQTRQVALSDGGQVFVGAKSAVDVRPGAETRTVVLKDGEAFFDLAGAARPITVVAGDAVIRASGARFNVCRTPYGIQIAVLEGRAEIVRKGLFTRATGPARVLDAGEQVRLERGEGLTAPRPVSGEPGAWRKGRLQYADAPLKEVVADANRYSERPIRLASADLGDMRVTASFRASAVDELIAKLDAGLPIAASREADGDIVLKADPAG